VDMGGWYFEVIRFMAEGGYVLYWLVLGRGDIGLA